MVIHDSEIAITSKSVFIDWKTCLKSSIIYESEQVFRCKRVRELLSVNSFKIWRETQRHIEKFWPSQICDTPIEGFEYAQNLSSDFVLCICTAVWSNTPRRYILVFSINLSELNSIRKLGIFFRFHPINKDNNNCNNYVSWEFL